MPVRRGQPVVLAPRAHRRRRVRDGAGRPARARRRDPAGPRGPHPAGRRPSTTTRAGTSARCASPATASSSPPTRSAPTTARPRRRSPPAGRVLVAGIGNVFLGDDGFGVALAGRLAERRLPAGVEVVDFGIRGMDLAYALLDGYDAVILLDATPRGGAPGTLYVIEPDVDAIAARGRRARHGPGEGARARAQPRRRAAAAHARRRLRARDAAWTPTTSASSPSSASRCARRWTPRSSSCGDLLDDLTSPEVRREPPS